MGRRCCFPAVYLSDPPVLPEQLQASRQQYVHAPGNGIYYPDKTDPTGRCVSLRSLRLAAVVTWIIPFIIDRVWQLVTFPWVYGILGLVLLAVVCVIGNTSYGAQLSLTFGGFTVQPSEFVKISFVFFVAAMFYQSTDGTRSLRRPLLRRSMFWSWCSRRTWEVR